MTSLLRGERAQDRDDEGGLALPQEELDTETESEPGIWSLKHKTETLAHEIEEEEEKATELPQLDRCSVLSLPGLSQHSLKAPTLQKEVLMPIPNQNVLLKDLDVLHNSSQMKNLSVFIEGA
ncbi:Centromere protein Q [Fukomys damarensis]|uniref:Centromere protein Q n=1 Tax=Fukomys damarensis TaxID=885580 RepID=A0A091E415_FUKDA|nr:Centromere protein Q [Fukomys damarensis]